MPYLDIKKVSSHLFWGLHYREKGNLYQDLMQYNDDSQRKTTVDDNLKRIKQYWFITRFIYYVFNISHYHQNVYISLLHQNLTTEPRFDDKKICVREANTTPTNILTKCWVMLASWLGVTYFLLKKNYCYSFLTNIRPEKSQGADLKTPLTLEEHAAYYNAQLSDSRAEITPEMKPHLLVLGIDLTNKTDISKKEVETAFRSHALQHHTDKGGESGNFHALADAKEALLNLIGTDENAQNLRDVEDLMQIQARIKRMNKGLFEAADSNEKTGYTSEYHR